MILGSAILKECINTGAITVKHGDYYCGVETLKIGPNSIDVRLSEEGLETSTKEMILDPPHMPRGITSTPFKFPRPLYPRECVLGCTEERFIINNLAAKEVVTRYIPMLKDVDFSIVQEYHGRSTVGRLFLASHVTAGFGDVGFSGSWTLEIVNLHPTMALMLAPGMRIGQIAFHVVIGADSVYEGVYRHQDYLPRPPEIGLERF
jgi:dCTP deaminase